jgi:hypothetical protein
VATARPDPGLTLAPSPAQLRRINREFVAAVRSWFPRKFYGRSGQRDAFIAGGLLRMCDTLNALMVVMTQTSTDESARVLLRSLFEQSIRLSWVLIDPASNYPRWLSQAHVELRTIHNELAQYRQTYLTSAQLAKVQGATEMDPIDQLARQVDTHWPARVLGLHSRRHPLSFHGLYTSVYRATSVYVHGSLNALDGTYVDLDGPWPTAHVSGEDRIVVYALGAPVLGITLVVAGQHFEWIDQALVRRFVDRATAETSRRRERN